MDQRLTLVKEMARPCRCGADIGTDHGYLICSLVEEGIAQRGIAADINAMPLDKARQEVIRRGLEERIQLVLTDGSHRHRPRRGGRGVLLREWAGI